jgi:hypothetical protein
MLAIVDHSPSVNSCIYSALLPVIVYAKCHMLPIACVTFAEPALYYSFRYIIEGSITHCSSFGVWEFCTLTTFLGSIENVIRGKGFEEISTVVFSENTKELILLGKACARATTGHFLCASGSDQVTCALFCGQ